MAYESVHSLARGHIITVCSCTMRAFLKSHVTNEEMSDQWYGTDGEISYPYYTKYTL